MTASLLNAPRRSVDSVLMAVGGFAGVAAFSTGIAGAFLAAFLAGGSFLAAGLALAFRVAAGLVSALGSATGVVFRFVTTVDILVLSLCTPLRCGDYRYYTVLAAVRRQGNSLKSATWRYF